MTLVVADGPPQEPAGGVGDSASGDKHIDDLAELVDGSVDISSPSGDLHLGLVHVPAVTDPVAAGSSSLGQQRREAPHPPVHHHVVNLDTGLDEQLLDVAVRQPQAQLPADSNDDHVG
jgi:hypothetical protein